MTSSSRHRRSGPTMHYIGLWLLCSVMTDCCLARGPHHPKSEVNKHRIEQQKHINEHLALDPEHIEEDLKEYQLPHEKKVEDLSDDERGYLYFKVHDLDGNDKLDGLEIFYSATHHSHSKQVHDHSHEHENGLEHKTDDEANDKPEDAEQNEVNPKPQSNESDPGTDLNIPNMNLLKFDNEQLIDDSFNHVVEVLDSFLSLADLNNDGYLNYAEYAAAIKIGEAMKEDGPKAEL